MGLYRNVGYVVMYVVVWKTVGLLGWLAIAGILGIIQAIKVSSNNSPPIKYREMLKDE